MELTLGYYGERCECDNSTSGACPVGTDIKHVCSGRPFSTNKIHIYVTRSGKRYILGEKFKIAYGVSRESALSEEYDDAIYAVLARSYD